MQAQKKKTKLFHWSQYRCPTGVLGRSVAANMNKDHWGLTTWGLKHVSIKRDSVVLDVGCGGGKTLSRLSRRAVEGKIFGIDISADMVDYSKQTNRKLVDRKRLVVSQGTVEKTGFQGDFFDLVTAVETYYFWTNLPLAFQEINRVLKNGGCFLIVSEMIKDGVYEVENAETIAKTQVILVSLPEIVEMLYTAGFSNVKVYKKRKSAWNVVLAQKV
jgi:ubiquinone/menaquinone biosynthesis C-methylase UbiE